MVVRLPSDLNVTDSNNSTIPNSSGSADNSAEGMQAGLLNNCLRSLAAIIAASWGGMYSGTSRPLAVQSGAIWRDTTGGATANVLKFYDGTDDIAIATVNTTANTVSFSGNLTGDVTGDITGNADTATALNSTALASAGITDLVGIASQAEAEAGTNNTKAATPLRVSQAITALASAAVVSSFTSTAQTVTADSETTVAHGLGQAIPAHQMSIRLKCTDAGGDQGWAQNDEFQLSASENSGNTGHVLRSDATNCYLMVMTGGLIGIHKTARTSVGLDETKWEVYIEAVAL